MQSAALEFAGQFSQPFGSYSLSHACIIQGSTKDLDIAFFRLLLDIIIIHSVDPLFRHPPNVSVIVSVPNFIH